MPPDLKLSFTGDWSPALMLALGLAGAALLAFLYRRTVRLVGPHPGLALLALKTAAFLLVLCALYRPVLEYREGGAARPELVVLVDDSRSMEIRDSLQGAARLEAAKDLLLEEGLLSRLEDFDVRVHSLSSGERRLAAEELRALEAALDVSDIDAALAAAVRASPDPARVAGVILLGDGADNRDLPLSECELAVPVHAIGLGSDAAPEAAPRDLAIGSLRADEVARTESTLLVTVEIRGDGTRRSEEPEAGKVEARSGSALVASTDLQIPQRGEAVEVTLAIALKTAGFQGFTVTIPRLDLETTWENNRRSFSTEVLSGKIQVLYLDGVLRPEYKFLRMALSKDPGIELTSMVLTDAQRLYQQGGDVTQGFPASLQGMRRYDAILLGDVPPSFFGGTQLEDLKAYVAAEGGGLLMNGGTSSLGAGLWAGTVLEQLLPFTLGGAGLGQVSSPLTMYTTQAGSRHPVFGGCREYFEPASSRSLPLLEGANRIERLKPGATLLAFGVGQAESGVPLLAVQRYGEGRCAGFTADTTWRWYLSLKSLGAESPYNRFWGQLVRWLARPEKRTPDLERPLLVRTNRRNYEPGERGELTVCALPEERAMPPSVNVILSKVDPEGPAAPIAVLECLAAADGQPIYRGAFTAPPGAGAGGHYKLVATVPRGAGEPDVAEARIAVGGVPLEFADARLNRRGLAELCERTGGMYYSMVQASKVVEDLRRRLLEESHIRVVKLWDHALFFPLVLALLTVEWVWRKRRMLVSLLIACALWGAGRGSLEAGDGGRSQEGKEEGRGLRGYVTLSDGTTFRGLLYSRSDKPLEIHDVERNEHRAVKLSEIERVNCEIERSELIQAWRFAEEGSPEKIRWGKPYPRQDYISSIRLAGSARVAGHLTGVLYLKTGDGPRKKLLLRAFQEGEKGQVSGDLLFVREVVLERESGGGERASVGAPGAGLKAARAFTPGRPERTDGRIDGSTARWDGLAPGKYSFVVELDGSVLVGWREVELGRAARTAVDSLVKSTQDFFDERQCLGYASGSGEMVHVLVDQRRHSASTSYGGEEVFRQVAVWSAYPTDRRWVVDCRAIVFRERYGKDGKPTPLRLKEDLAERDLGAGKPLEIVVKSKE